MMDAGDVVGTEAPPRHRPRLPYLPGLDGVRGMAALGVLFFHGGFSWARGGYLGVSLFFTLSGFLITRNLLAEYGSNRHIDLLKFWAGRIRRLAPALLLTLALVLLLGPFVWDESQRAAMAADVQTSLAYVANWHFLFSGHSYADLFTAPSPLQHCWSIAIEEQFYVIYPLLLAAVFALSRGSTTVLRRVLLTLAAISLALPFVVGSHDRIYYGTDTRSFEILVGCLLAVALLRRRPRRPSPASPWIGVASLIVTLVAWGMLDQTTGWLYRGGFALIALVNVALVRAATMPGPTATVLSVRPLRYVGRISYGLYLYHWPIFLWLSPAHTGLSGVVLFGVRMGVTFALASLSLFFVELPIRERRMFRSRTFGPAIATAVSVIVLASIAIFPATRSAADDINRDAARDLPAAVAPSATQTTVDPDAIPTPLRVYVYGDSTANQFALGLYAWGQQHPGIVEVKANVHHSCAIAAFAAIRFTPEGDASQDECRPLFDQIPSDIATFQPDVALVLSGPANTADVQLTGEDEWRSLGDPAVDEFMLLGMQETARRFTTAGVPVLWFDLAHSDTPDAAKFGGDYVASDRARIDRYNELVDQLVALVPATARVSWASHIDELAPDTNLALRPDGVHVFPDGVRQFLDEWLWADVTVRYRTARTQLAASTTPATP